MGFIVRSRSGGLADPGAVGGLGEGLEGLVPGRGGLVADGLGRLLGRVFLGSCLLGSGLGRLLGGRGPGVGVRPGAAGPVLAGGLGDGLVGGLVPGGLAGLGFHRSFTGGGPFGGLATAESVGGAAVLARIGASH